MNIHKHSAMYALTAVIITIAAAMGIFFSGLPTWLNFISYVIFVTVLVFGIKNWRDKERGGFISYGKVMGYSTWVTVYFSILITIWTYVFFTYIAHDEMVKMQNEQMAKQVEQFHKMHMEDSEIKNATDMMKRFMTPGVQAAFSLFGNIIFLTIGNLIVAAILKRDAPSNFDQTNSSAV